MSKTENTEATMDPRSALIAAVVARMFQKVEDFNRQVIDLPIPEKPAMLQKRRIKWAETALNEEINEFEAAAREGDILETADALLDMVFFALGRMVEMGIPASAIMDGIARANMQKERGELSKRPGSMGYDAVKPAGWQPPDHSWVLSFSLEDLEKARKWDALSPVLKRIADLRFNKGQDYNTGVQLHDYFPFGHYSYAQMVHVKVTRIRALVGAMGSGKPVKFESLLDTVEDLINYSTYYAEAIDEGRVQNEGDRA